MSHDALLLEQALSFHCASAMAGVKPADLLCWRGPEEQGDQLLARYTALLGRHHIRVRQLRRRGQRRWLLIYRPALLGQCFRQGAVQQLLQRDGYPVHLGLEACLRLLSQRLEQEEFPHEIGLFLGYPPGDVEGFRRHKGQGCKLCGVWKVYDRVEEAAATFQTIRHCRESFARRLEQGQTLEQVLAAVS